MQLLSLLIAILPPPPNPPNKAKQKHILSTLFLFLPTPPLTPPLPFPKKKKKKKKKNVNWVERMHLFSLNKHTHTKHFLVCVCARVCVCVCVCVCWVLIPWFLQSLFNNTVWTNCAIENTPEGSAIFCIFLHYLVLLILLENQSIFFQQNSWQCSCVDLCSTHTCIFAFVCTHKEAICMPDLWKWANSMNHDQSDDKCTGFGRAICYW